jgi:hypothetical protein
MSDDPFYDRLNAMKRSKDFAERIVERIWSDVTDRRGWRQEADLFDDEVKMQILDAWVGIVRRGTKKR